MNQQYRPEDITVGVRAVPNRGAPWERSRRTIESSDIGTRYVRYVQPSNQTRREAYLSFMDWMAAVPTPLVLMLEDDALVNRHILHNLATWPAVHEPRFGAGWCMTPGGRRNIHDYIYRRNRTRWHDREYQHASVGVLLRAPDVPMLRARMVAWYEGRPGDLAHADMALSSAVWRTGRRIALHSPSLVEHPLGPSTLGHPHTIHDTTRGHFSATYRR
jgi:hypothetical protein